MVSSGRDMDSLRLEMWQMDATPQDADVRTAATGGPRHRESRRPLSGRALTHRRGAHAQPGVPQK
ncbi:hypothetical protein GCM10010409_06400 [Mycolicibacterium diernhoferi]